jgi:hypothetical protein
MKTYYFIKKNGVKKGPFSLEDLSKFNFQESDLVWRNDQDDWKSAKEFEELKKYIFNKPPLTPKELKSVDFFKNLKKSLPNMFLVAIFSSITIGAFTAGIAMNSWQEYLSEAEKRKNVRFKNEKNFDNSATRNGFAPQIVIQHPSRYPSNGYSIHGGNESIFAEKQIFIFRPLYLFYSPIYLKTDERKNIQLLFFNLFLSSLTFSLIVLSIITIWRYFLFINR